jgi:hypothetical protein
MNLPEIVGAYGMAAGAAGDTGGALNGLLPPRRATIAPPAAVVLRRLLMALPSGLERLFWTGLGQTDEVQRPAPLPLIFTPAGAAFR